MSLLNHYCAVLRMRVAHLRHSLKEIAQPHGIDPANAPLAAQVALAEDDQDGAAMCYHATPVLEFHKAYGHPVELFPTVPTIEQRLLRVKLLAEELTEFASACNVAVQIEQTLDGEYKVLVIQEEEQDRCDLIEAADALGDLRYVVDGGNLIFGFPGEDVLGEIHGSNMSKLGADGKPITRPDGKTLKGPNYRPPNLAPILGLPIVPAGAAPSEPGSDYVENAKCANCGCTDNRACLGGCSWLAVDRMLGIGICSSCPDALAAWRNQREAQARDTTEGAV